MAPRSTVFVCTQCGHESAKWHGRCPGCEEWNTLVEERPVSAASSRRSSGTAAITAVVTADLHAPALTVMQGPALRRFVTGIGDFDRVLGGGLVPGSLVLIGGAPGIGK